MTEEERWEFWRERTRQFHAMLTQQEQRHNKDRLERLEFSLRVGDLVRENNRQIAEIARLRKVFDAARTLMRVPSVPVYPGGVVAPNPPEVSALCDALFACSADDRAEEEQLAVSPSPDDAPPSGDEWLRRLTTLQNRAHAAWDAYYAEFGDMKMSQDFTARIEALMAQEEAP